MKYCGGGTKRLIETTALFNDSSKQVELNEMRDVQSFVLLMMVGWVVNVLITSARHYVQIIKQIF